MQFDRPEILPYTFGDDIQVTDKQAVYDISSWVSIAPPIVAGILIDLGYIHVVLFLAPILMVLSPVIEQGDHRSHENTLLITKVVVTIGADLLDMALIITMVRWFRDQISLPIVFALYFTVMPLAGCIWTAKHWTEFTKPAQTPYPSSFHYDALQVTKLEDLETILMAISMGSAWFIIFIDRCANRVQLSRNRRLDAYDLEQRASTAGLNGRNNAAVSSETNEGGLCKGLKHL